MVIVETVRMYESQTSVNRAVGQFRRHHYPAVITAKVREKVYVIKVVKHTYPFMTAVIRKLDRMERKKVA